jgi:hypothetical protein
LDRNEPALSQLIGKRLFDGVKDTFMAIGGDIFVSVPRASQSYSDLLYLIKMFFL